MKVTIFPTTWNVENDEYARIVYGPLIYTDVGVPDQAFVQALFKCKSCTKAREVLQLMEPFTPHEIYKEAANRFLVPPKDRSLDEETNQKKA